MLESGWFEIAFGAARRANAVDNEIAISAFTLISRLVAAQIAEDRFRATLVALVAVFAIVFSLGGIYVNATGSVTLREGEFGIEITLGARNADVFAFVLTRVIRLAAIGVIVGISVKLLSSRFIETHLWNVSPNDWLISTAIDTILVFVAGMSALVPGLLAVRTSPENLARTNWQSVPEWGGRISGEENDSY